MLYSVTFLSVLSLLLIQSVAFTTPRAFTKKGIRLGAVDSITSAVQARIKLWKEISDLERGAVAILSALNDDVDDKVEDLNRKREHAYEMLANSISLRGEDCFLELAEKYNHVNMHEEDGWTPLLTEMEQVGPPPHIEALMLEAQAVREAVSGVIMSPTEIGLLNNREVDLSSTFSDTVTDRIRVKVSSHFDADQSDPTNGRFMFYYQVAIHNEGTEPIQIVARMWEIEKVGGQKETVRGAGIMSTQPIIRPGGVYMYESRCPLKVSALLGQRVLGSMQGIYTACKGKLGEVSFPVSVGRFHFILPDFT